jgi:phage shock protein A
MESLIEKLNTLVRASINEFVADVGGGLPIPPPRRRRDLDYEVDALRERVNQALEYQDDLAAQLQELLNQIEGLDRAADDALLAGDEANARRRVQRVKRLQQRAAMLEAELEQHRRATAELIEKVNYLDSLVADISRRKEKETEEETRPSSRTVHIKVTTAEEEPERKLALTDAASEQEPQRYSPPASPAEDLRKQRAEDPEAAGLPEVQRLTEALRKARRSIERAERSMGAVQDMKAEFTGKPLEEKEPTDKGEIDRDLAARRARLTKPE